MDDLDLDLDSLDPRFAINEDDLAGEWHRQPKLYIALSLALATATGNRMRGQVVVKTIEADLASRIRKEGLGEGVRVTEDGIKAAVTKSEHWLNAQKLLIEATEQEELAKGKQEAGRQRIQSLKWLTILTGVGAPPEDEDGAIQSAKRAARGAQEQFVRERRAQKNQRGG